MAGLHEAVYDGDSHTAFLFLFSAFKTVRIKGLWLHYESVKVHGLIHKQGRDISSLDALEWIAL